MPLSRSSSLRKLRTNSHVVAYRGELYAACVSDLGVAGAPPRSPTGRRRPSGGLGVPRRLAHRLGIADERSGPRGEPLWVAIPSIATDFVPGRRDHATANPGWTRRRPLRPELLKQLDLPEAGAELTAAPPSGPWGPDDPSMSHRGETPHMTAISLRMNFFGGAPWSRHHRDTVSRLTSNFSMRSACLRPPNASAIWMRHPSVSGGTSA